MTHIDTQSVSDNDPPSLDLGEFYRLVSERVEEITAYLGRACSSHDRCAEMLDVTQDDPAVVFWPVFHQTWPVCDDTWWLSKQLLSTLRRQRDEAWDDGAGGPAIDLALFSMDEHNAGINRDREFYGSLPYNKPFPVYRGCSRSRVRGISWTTDRQVAMSFAQGHRGISVPDSVLASATITLDAIFTVSQDREESEIILDPRRLRGLKVEPVTPRPA